MRLDVKNNEITKFDFEHPLKATILKLLPVSIVLSSYTGYMDDDNIELGIDLDHSNVKLISLGYTMVLSKIDSGMTVDLRIKMSDSVFEYVPHPLILGRSSRLSQITRIEMCDLSTLLYLDSFVIGRVHMKESFQFESLNTKCTLKINNELVLFEKSKLVPDNIEFRPFEVYGTLILVNYTKSFETVHTKELSLVANKINYQDKQIGQIIRIGALSSDFFWNTIQNMIY